MSPDANPPAPHAVDIAADITTYLGDRSPVERAASFDYCFNYFQAFRERDELELLTDPSNIEASCLHLGYYLASWGMLRGSTVLHTKSYRFFVPLIRAISTEQSATWRIDAHRYTDANISRLLELKNRMSAAITAESAVGALVKTPTDTLVTKIMLGVFGSIPAFDTFFKRGFRTVTDKVVKVDRHTLQAIGDFYAANTAAIDEQRVRTLSFASDRPTRRRYTRAKVIDMVFLIEGGGS